MLKLSNKCRVCIAVKDDKKLLNRIYKSTAFLPHSHDTLSKIHQDCSDLFSYDSLKTHVKKHQLLNAEDYTKAMQRHVAKRAESSILKKRFDAIEVQDSIMAVGMDKLQKGEMEVTADHLLRASKDKADIIAKTKDQMLQMAEMVAHFASGENTDKANVYDRRALSGEAVTNYDPAVPVAENPNTGA